MRVRFLSPADLDLSAAPEDGTLYVDSLSGSERNSGLTAAKAKRLLPEIIAAGSKVYLRGGRRYRGKLPTLANPAHAPLLSGTALSPVVVKSWGGSRAMICGDMLVRGWGAVTESHGNAWLATNGEQLTHERTCLWTPHFVGDDMLYPSYWSPTCPTDPADLGQVSRRDFLSFIDGAEAIYTTPGANVQGWGAGHDTPESRDATKALEPDGITCEMATRDGKWQSTLWIRHPDIATHYGDGEGPIGAAVQFRANGGGNGSASNNMAWAYVTGYDHATGTIVAKTPVTTGILPYPPNSDCQWRIVGHPFDLRQPGQYASIAGKAWRVRGDWQRGESSMATYGVAIQPRGDYFRFEEIDFGRVDGRAWASIVLDLDEAPAATTSASTVVRIAAGVSGEVGMESCELREMLTESDNQALLTQASAVTLGLFRARNLRLTQGWNCRGITSLAIGYDVDGLDAAELGKTVLNSSTVNGEALKEIRNVSIVHCSSAHGNGISLYQGSNRGRLAGISVLDSTRAYTQQLLSSGGALVDVPNRDNQIDGMFVLGPRATSAAANAPIIGGYTFRSDNGLSACDFSRILIGDGGDMELNGAAFYNRNGRVHRVAVSKVTTTVSDGWEGDSEEGPVQFLDVVTNNSYLPSAKGGTESNFRVAARPAWSGAIDEDAWEMLTVNDARDGFEGITIGDARVGWTIPAWSASAPNPGTPVDLVLSRLWFANQSQSGKTIAHVLRARPMSLLSLPAGVADNDAFLLDQGRIVALDRLTAASYTIAVDEQPQAKSGGTWSPAGAAKRTLFEIVRMW